MEDKLALAQANSQARLNYPECSHHTVGVFLFKKKILQSKYLTQVHCYINFNHFLILNCAHEY